MHPGPVNRGVEISSELADGPLSVFDLSIDPSEKKNIAAEHPEIVAQAKKYFSDAHTPSQHWKFKSMP